MKCEIQAKFTQIGKISNGIEGSDEYLLIKTKKATSAKSVKEWLLSRVYRDTTKEAGGYFCHRVTVMRQPYISDEFVCIVHHQYDV
jgi:histidinol-phosphate/aromatic aminotransferase/cobyric acid decarboxylase-like protein